MQVVLGRLGLDVTGFTGEAVAGRVDALATSFQHLGDWSSDVCSSDLSWELDYYLHENPEQKRAAYAWLTDFVGWLPMPGGGDRKSVV